MTGAMRSRSLRIYADTHVFGGVFNVSWNFKHIVHFERIPLYNAVNTLRGYRRISIHSPREVIAYANEGV